METLCIYTGCMQDAYISKMFSNCCGLMPDTQNGCQLKQCPRRPILLQELILQFYVMGGWEDPRGGYGVT
jgi:hypothetical protein